MYLKIPNHQILDFGMLKFAEHVLDTSPVISTRSQMRLVMKAVEAIAEAKDGIADMSDDVAKLFQDACDAAPIPVLNLVRLGASGQPLGDAEPVPKRAFGPFFEAVESMTAERPAAAELPVAAE